MDDRAEESHPAADATPADPDLRSGVTGDPIGAVAAVDIGTSVGRVVVGHVGPKALRLEEVHRFANEPVALPDGIHWDVLHLYRETLAGLRTAGRGDGSHYARFFPGGAR